MRSSTTEVLMSQAQQVARIVAERLERGESIPINGLLAELSERFDERSVRSGIWSLISNAKATVLRGNVLVASDTPLHLAQG